jgi:hypothetical protein
MKGCLRCRCRGKSVIKKWADCRYSASVSCVPLSYKHAVEGDRVSSVRIETRYGLDGPRIEPRWGRDFLHPSRPGVKRPVRGVNHPPQSSAEIKKRVELYLLLPVWAFMACSRANFIFFHTPWKPA